jgi:hypothetical protein
MDGAIFAIRTPALLAGKTLVGEGTIGHIMPREHCLDIDELDDLEEAARRLAARTQGQQASSDCEEIKATEGERLHSDLKGKQ